MRYEDECDSIINEGKLFAKTHTLDDDLPSNFKSVRMRKKNARRKYTRPNS